MSKENFEQFMKQVADSQDLQAKIGEAITEDALVALGAAHGCEFSIEDLQGSAELSDGELDAVAGGAAYIKFDGVHGRRLRIRRGLNSSINSSQDDTAGLGLSRGVQSANGD